jgi:hypothetical protein
MDVRWILDHLDRSDGIPRADWEAIWLRIESTIPPERIHEALTAVALEWLREVARALDGEYLVAETPSFAILSGFGPKPARTLTTFLEGARRRILTELLPEIANDDGPGKLAVVHLLCVEEYTSYIAHFLPDSGEYSATAGMFLFRPDGSASAAGYGQVVLLGSDPLQIERIAAHELTHACLSHLPIPGWLNEGLADTVEGALLGSPAFGLSREDLDEHRACWADGAIREFWSGRSVHRPDDRSRLTYQLGRALVEALSDDYAKFREFVLRADWADGGESAAREVFGSGLGDVVASILGPGDWGPRLGEEPPSEA